jgi:signal transduction histidine kinase/ligand-binding sensor domain-containing protein/CheY-like chemotaxis protein
MWFATRSGVASYDGSEWTTYGIAEGLDWMDQSAIRPGIKGGMWSLAAGAPFRVFRFDDRQWNVLPISPLARTVSASCLEVLDADGRTVVAVGTEAGLFLWDGEWRRLDAADGLPGSDVRALRVVGSRLFVGTTEGVASLSEGVVQDLTGRLKAVPERGTLGLATSLIDDSLWLAGHSWLGRLDTSGEFVLERRLDEPLAVNYFTAGVALEADAHGGVYFGNPTILRYYHPEEGFSLVDRKSGMITEGATSVFVDRERNAWIAGMRGVTKIVSRRFLTMREENGLLEDEVSAVIERRDGSFLLGHPNGLSIWTGSEIEQVDLYLHRQDHVAWVRVLDLEEDHDGRVWIAASWRGLARMDEAGTLEWFGGDDRLSGQVTSVRTTEDGRLWVSLGDNGLWTRQGGRFVPVQTAPEIVYARRIFRASSGGLYVATGESGVGRIEDGRFVGLARGASPEEDNVYAVLEDPDGTVWIGAEAGLLLLDGNRLVRPEKDAPRITRPVYFLVRDTAGHLWCGTDNGVLRWDGRELRGYSVAQGLAGRETNRAAGMVDSRGRIWIGTGFGLSIYREDWELPDPAPPLVGVESVLAGGTVHRLHADLELGSADNDLTFALRAVSFVDEDNISMRSRLEGLDDQWTSSVGPSRRELRYFHLPAGTYRLHLQAENVDGVKSEVYRSAWVTIAPPFFQRSSVLALAAIFVATLLYLAHRFLAQRRYARELEAEVDRRIARVREVEEELTRAKRLESLAAFAGGVAHDFNNLLSVILGNLSLMRTRVGDARPLDAAEEAVWRATELTGQFLTFARGGSPVRKVSDVGAVVREAASLVMAGGNVRGQFAIPDDLWCAEVDVGQMSQAFNNLLLNAVQAMPDGGWVRITAANLERAPEPLPPNRAIRISVEDDGPGISPDVRDRVFDPFFTTKEQGQGLGLSSAYSIVSRHGGMLKIDTGSDRGAKFDVILMAAEGRPEPESATPPGPVSGSGRILVMDDDDDVRTVLQAMLEGMGYTVLCTHDGESALERYAEAIDRGNPFDAVILDLTVRGGMGGAETIERLVALDSEVRAIVASGYSENPVMAEHERYGFRGAIAKPFLPANLARVLQRVLGTADESGARARRPST